MSEIPEVFAIFEQKLAHVLSFNLRQKGQKKAIEELLVYFSGIVERASKAEARIAELEAAQRWIPVGERLPKEEGWYYAGVLGRFGDHYTHDVYFYAEDAAFRWKDCEGDKVYCWLDGVPALPTPPEVQE